MASVITNAGVDSILRNIVTWEVDVVQARLCVAGAVDPDATSMVGYVAAAGTTDQVVTGRTREVDATANRIVFDGDDLAWAGVAETRDAVAIAVYTPGASDADALPLCVIDLAAVSQPLAGKTLARYAVPPTGLFYLQQ